eukprot:TRINITY_DN667_c0_g1_i4.p1 TRINITY_DN667_c0_g1~~TRINITY_DN667_c0_g1_i4.p1  ORF type:complete len:202 (-),score=24.68 TRINITY_DN667_c0_g1_i4:28-633(-)
MPSHGCGGDSPPTHASATTAPGVTSNRRLSPPSQVTVPAAASTRANLYSTTSPGGRESVTARAPSPSSPATKLGAVAGDQSPNAGCPPTMRTYESAGGGGRQPKGHGRHGAAHGGGWRPTGRGERRPRASGEPGVGAWGGGGVTDEGRRAATASAQSVGGGVGGGRWWSTRPRRWCGGGAAAAEAPRDTGAPQTVGTAGAS